jgi:hypothetical protein
MDGQAAGAGQEYGQTQIAAHNDLKINFLEFGLVTL